MVIVLELEVGPLGAGKLSGSAEGKLLNDPEDGHPKVVGFELFLFLIEPIARSTEIDAK